MRNVFFLLLFASCNIQAKYIPKEFLFLYEEQELTISVSLPNDVYEDMSVVANYDGVSKVKNEKLLKEKLLYSGIKKEVVELVFNKIVGKECSFSKCESIDVDFNYDAKSLSVIVSSELLAEDFEQQPYTNISPSLNGVISTNSLNSSYYTDSLNYTYSNETLFGLGHGFVDTGVNISGSESGTKSDVDKVIYYHNFSGHRLNFGYSEFSGENNDNASGILDFTTANDRYFVSFGTSNNLLKKKKEQFKRVYFDMKSKGLVRFLRDGKVIKSNYYNQGQNFVTFSELPQGNYQLEIRIKAEGFPEEVQYRQINNNLNQFSIDNSDFNVSIMAFELDDEYFADDYASVGELAYAARHDNGLIWGASARFSPLGSELGLYTGLEINNVSTSAYIASGRGGEYFNYHLGVGRLSMNYQELDLVTDNELMAALYGTENSQQWSANYGIDLFDGLVNMYVNDSVRERDNREYRNLTSSLTYSRTIFRNTEFSMTYSRSINENSEDYHIEDNYIENILSMSVSIPLENDSAYTGNFQTSDRSGSTLIQTLSNDALMENEFIVVDGSVTSTLNGVDSSFGLSSNYLFSNGKYQSDGYFSYDSNQEKLANINLSTTLVSDWKNLYFTDDTDSESYIIVKNTGDDEAASRVETGQVVLRSDNSTRAVPVYNEDTLITVPEYTTYQYSVDNEVSGYSSAKQNRGTDFSFPGTLNVIENKTQKVISFMTYFENMNEDSLNDIECLGDGCVNISRIGDGIYSVTVYEDTDYKIVSNGEYCLVSRDDLNYYQGKSRCFPKVIDDPMSGLEIVKLGDENEEVTYVYLGKLNKDVPKYLESKLSNEGMKLVKYEFGKDNEFLFISVPRNKLNELELYVNSSVWSEIEKYATQSYDFEGYSYVY